MNSDGSFARAWLLEIEIKGLLDMTLNGSCIAADVAGKRNLANKSYINIGRI
jgi:hypothetical protein